MTHSMAWKRMRLVVKAIVTRTNRSSLVTCFQKSKAAAGLSASDVVNEISAINATISQTVALKGTRFGSLETTQANNVNTTVIIASGIAEGKLHTSRCGLMNEIQE